VARAARTLNSIERQILSALHGHQLRLQARAISASLPVNSQEGLAQSKAIRDALTARLEINQRPLTRDEEEQLASDIRAACIDGLALLNRLRDEPQETEAGRIRVAMWLTLVGLVAVYVISAAFPDVTDALIAGALGGMLGSLSALILRTELSLGLIVLAPVAGALNAMGGLVLVSFLAQEEIQVLGQVFRQSWTTPTSLTSLAVALLLGFFGGLFARIAVAGAAPLLGGSNASGQRAAPGSSAAPGSEPVATQPIGSPSEDVRQQVSARDVGRTQSEPAPNGELSRKARVRRR
jgi:hypothetical protein